MFLEMALRSSCKYKLLVNTEVGKLLYACAFVIPQKKSRVIVRNITIFRLNFLLSKEYSLLMNLCNNDMVDDSNRKVLNTFVS